MSDTNETTAAPNKLDAWKQAKRHTVTLPSGTVVDIILPNLPKMLQAGDVPNSLLTVAVEQARGGSITEETIRSQFDFFKFLVARTVVDPKLHEDDVAELPFEDIEMLVELASRNRDFDAVGHHLAGLERQSEFRRFRGLDLGNTLGSSL